MIRFGVVPRIGQQSPRSRAFAASFQARSQLIRVRPRTEPAMRRKNQGRVAVDEQSHLAETPVRRGLPSSGRSIASPDEVAARAARFESRRVRSSEFDLTGAFFFEDAGFDSDR